MALILLHFIVRDAYGAEPSGSAQTWQEVEVRWNTKLSITDQLLLCINFAAISGSIAYGSGNEELGSEFVEIANIFEGKLRQLHSNEITDLLIRSTQAVTLNTSELLTENDFYEEWKSNNLNRCEELQRRPQFFEQQYPIL